MEPCETVRRPTCVWVCLALTASAFAAFGGPLQRVPNTSLQMPLSPPTVGYTNANAFPGLAFTNPVCFVSPPGETNRLFIVEKRGRIVVITNLAAPTRTIFMDIVSRVTSAADTSFGGEEGLLGMDFHPGYRTNNYFYVFYTGNATTTPGTGRHDILSRFRISGSNTNQGDSTSETRYIVQFDEASNHNGGDMHFGEDGYLYVALGDEGGAFDNSNNSQKINKDYFSAFLRIDVDKKPGSLVPNSHSALPSLTNYTVPPDNPFIGASNFNGLAVNPNTVRTEFWAVGMRNPWRFSFDRVTDTLYLGHVGQGQSEWVNILTKGANCGWNYYEGTVQWTNPAPASLAFSPPLVQYGHTGGRNCIIGGIVYRGYRISQLYGAYLYADYGSGEVWTLRHSGNTVTQNTIILANPSHRIAAFGVDPSNGDALYAAVRGGIDSTVERIIYNTATNGAPLPATLAQTGVFTNLASLSNALDPLQPAAGIVPYDINVPFWSDNALKSRWFSVPNTNLTIGFNSSANWSFPTGTVWIKHFNLELTNGVAASAKRLETRLLVKNSTGIYGAVYRWGNSTTNAALVAEAGLDESFVVNDGAGILRTQVWHYPSRSECVICHTPEGGFALGFKTEQLHRNFNYGLTTTNQIAALSDAGYFSSAVSNLASLPALSPASDTNAPLESRVRSLLAANCAQCHQPGGSAQQALWDGRLTTSTALAGLINGALMNNLGNANKRVIVPLAPSNSVLLTRIATRDLSLPGSIQMPPLDSTLVDTQAVALVSQWISSLSNTFWVGASPPFQNVLIGGTAAGFVIDVVRTVDFTNTVDLALSDLPPGVNAAILPVSVTGSNATLSIIASNNAAAGTYPFTITASSSGQTNVAMATLVINTNVPGTLLWSGASETDTNWSTSLNWTNLSTGGYGPPGPANNVIFAATGATPVVGAINNIVESTTTIKSLWYNHGATPNINHTTRINPGATLNIVGTTNITGGTGFTPANFSLLVGTNGSVTPSMTATITGAGGSFNIDNTTGTVAIAQFHTASKHVGVNLRAVLDLSGLDNFNANIGRLLIGSMNNGSAGTFYLAKTNLLRLSSATAPQLDIGDNNSNQGDPSLLYLGITNAILADQIATGRAKGTNGSIYFNPAFVPQSPRVFFRGQDGVSRVSSWIISDLLTATGTADVTNPVSTNDFTGGTIDAFIDSLIVGKTTAFAPGAFATSNRVATGSFTFSGGMVDVNNLTNAWQLGNANSGTASWDSAIGVVNVNGGTLRVNNNLVLAKAVASISPAVAQGTLQVRGGTLAANNIQGGGGNARLLLTNATFFLTNSAGTANAGISALNTTNSTIHLRLNGNLIFTNIATINLAAAGLNVLAIDGVTNVSTTTVFPLISYSSFVGSIANFTLAPLPAGFAGTLLNNAANKTIELRLTHSGVAAPGISAIHFSPSALLLSGTNGVPLWNYYLLTSTNLALPLSNWSSIATGLFDGSGSFQITNPLDPNSSQNFFLLQVP